MPVKGEQSLRELPGIGAAREAALERLGLSTVRQLLDYFPRSYEDRTVQANIADLAEETAACFSAMVIEAFQTSHIRHGMDVTRGKIADDTAQVVVTFFNQTYVSKALRTGETYLFYGKLSGVGRRRTLINPQFEKAGEGRMTGGIFPVYALTAGISNHLLHGLMRCALEAVGEKREVLPAEILTKYQLAQTEFSYRNIHFPASWEALLLARRRLMFEELFCLSVGLAWLRGRRRMQGAIPFSVQDLSEFYVLLPFAPTTAQKRSIEEAQTDLTRAVPMNRLLQGDVGSGKTVVAAACAWLAVRNACQCALMAPTELLAQQHRVTMEALLGQAGIRIALLTGSKTATEKRQIRTALEAGEIDLIIGTHALLTAEVTFARLGLVIMDEQHRFGVEQRASLSAKAGTEIQPHVLVMSATPIPRTLALMIYGDLDLSVIDTLPPGRQPVATYVVREDKRERMYGFVRRHVAEGRQVYIVCPAVSEEDSGMKAANEYGAHLQNDVFPDLRTAVIHGKMKSKDKEKIMASFVRGDTDILVSTTVIEVGVDVPNAVLMIVENAERFGLSQLHQLRGRVGRGEYASFCILMTETKSKQTLTRLKTLASTTDGFKIAEEDLKLRGPGDFFGARQHGLPPLKIADLAGDMRLLHEAQEAAQFLLKSDPTLQEKDHQLLRGRVLQLFEEKQGMLN